MFGSFFNEKHNRVLGTLVLVAAVVALASYAYFTLKQASDWNMGMSTINVAGDGEVMATPDVAQFSFTVRTIEDTAEAAQAANASTSNAVMAYLKEQGVEEKDIKTDGYNLYPHYNYDTRPCVLGAYCPPSEPKQDGTEVTQTVTVKVRVMDTAGELVAGVGTRGASDISSLAFTIDDPEGLKDEARNQAIADARAQAEVLADQLGVRLGDMVSYYEDVPYNPAYGGGMEMDSAMSAKAESVPAPEFSAGESTITSRVNLTYEIK